MFDILFDVTAVDWNAMFVPANPLIDVIVRGTIMYWALFLLLRFVIRREVGELGITDLLVVVLLADAAQNALSGDYKSIPEGIVLVAVIAGWAYLINLLSYRSRRFERFARPRKILLVDRGRIQHRNLARELISQEELFTLLREAGVERLTDVKSMRVEPDGKVSVITYRRDDSPHTISRRYE